MDDRNDADDSPRSEEADDSGALYTGQDDYAGLAVSDEELADERGRMRGEGRHDARHRGGDERATRREHGLAIRTLARLFGAELPGRRVDTPSDGRRGESVSPEDVTDSGSSPLPAAVVAGGRWAARRLLLFALLVAVVGMVVGTVGWGGAFASFDGQLFGGDVLSDASESAADTGGEIRAALEALQNPGTEVRVEGASRGDALAVSTDDTNFRHVHAAAARAPPPGAAVPRPSRFGMANTSAVRECLERWGDRSLNYTRESMVGERVRLFPVRSARNASSTTAGAASAAAGSRPVTTAPTPRRAATASTATTATTASTASTATTATTATTAAASASERYHIIFNNTTLSARLIERGLARRIELPGDDGNETETETETDTDDADVDTAAGTDDGRGADDASPTVGTTNESEWEVALARSEREARDDGRGLWSCGTDGGTGSTPTAGET